MIQRIQSVYLFLTACLLGLAMCLPMGQFIGADSVRTEVFEPLGVTLADGSFMYTWGLFVILLLSAIIAFCTIFLFRNRRLQLRMTVFNILLQIGFYVVFVVFVFALKENLGAKSFQLGWALCLPAVSVIFSYLANHAIRRDEMLVRAADRLR